MMKPTGKIVYIPQLDGMKRTIYLDDDGMKCIMINGTYWGMDGYKKWLKDKYSINISYEILD